MITLAIQTGLRVSELTGFDLRRCRPRRRSARALPGAGWAARRGACGVAGPFPRGLPPNHADAFQRTWLSSDLRRVQGRVPVDDVMAGRQVMRVLRRFLPFSPPSRAGRDRVPRGWRACGPGAPAPRPACPHSSHRRARSRWISSLRGQGGGPGAWSFRTALFFRTSGIPPNRATRSGLPAADPGFEAGTQPVRCLDLGFVLGRHLGHRGLVLGTQGLQHRCLGVPAQRAEPPDIAGEQVVLDDAPVFRAVVLTML